MNKFPLVILSLVWIVHSTESSSSSPYNLWRNPAKPSTTPTTPDSRLWIRCYEDLGCLNNTEEWYDRLSRPITEEPLFRHIIKTTFALSTKALDSHRRIVDVEILPATVGHVKASRFDSRETVKPHILIHDFTSNGYDGWIKHSVKSLLAIDAGNVISVDWTAGTEPPYSIAIQNARVVALEAAALLRIFVNYFGIKPDKFYLIGQGLGAHIAGYIGQEINGIGRITGLDPVGLFFKNMPPQARLDPKDAVFVDVINTDVETNPGQGSGDPYGHLNFFPNGGLPQPGCNVTSFCSNLNKISRDMSREGEAAPGCSRKRAAKYFTASIDERENCLPMGYACNDYLTFERGDCLKDLCKIGTTCATMGYYADDVANNFTAIPTTKFFIDTNDCRPYCTFGYKITITLSAPLGSGADSHRSSVKNPDDETISGIFYVTFFSDIEGITFQTKLNTDNKLLKARGENVFLSYKKPPEITMPDRLLLRFQSGNNDAVSAHVRRVRITNLPDYDGNSVTHLCGKEVGELPILKSQAKEAVEFTLCDAKKFGSKESPSTLNFLRQRERGDPGEIIILPGAPATAFDKIGGDINSEEYDESEPQEPAEDDYYTNR